MVSGQDDACQHHMQGGAAWQNAYENIDKGSHVNINYH